MTLANRLTLGRFLCAPVVFVSGWNMLWVICLAAYVLGLATDAADGRLARMTNTTTAFGRAMDSAADKVLVAAAMLGLTAAGKLSAWLPFLFIVREFSIFGLRSIRMKNGMTVAEISDRLGRFRFLILHAGILALLLPSHPAWATIGGIYLVALATFIAYLAFTYYVIRDWQALYSVMMKDKT